MGDGACYLTRAPRDHKGKYATSIRAVTSTPHDLNPGGPTGT